MTESSGRIPLLQKNPENIVLFLSLRNCIKTRRGVKMKVEHVALWAKDLEAMKLFYCTYFNAIASEKYVNRQKEFSSYFLSFESGARLEIMHRPGIESSLSFEAYGLAHLAISTGARVNVDRLTEKLMAGGYTIAGEPRVTGDGYYESVVLDPEGNRIEITV